MGFFGENVFSELVISLKYQLKTYQLPAGEIPKFNHITYQFSQFCLSANKLCICVYYKNT